MGTAVRGALLALAMPLSLIRVTRTRVKGMDQVTEADPVAFHGVIAPAEEWRRMLPPGGELSYTTPLLVVSSEARTDVGDALTITVGDIVAQPNGARFRVVDKIDEGERFGVVIYTLGELSE